MGSSLSDPSVVVIGPVDHPEMSELLSVLESHCPESSRTTVANLTDALRQFEDDGVVCDLGLVLHTVPGEHLSSDVVRLLTVAPLTRWLVVGGVWCESIGRTEDAWPSAFQVSLRLLGPRLQRELQVISGERPALMPTAGRDEAFEFNASPLPKPSRSSRVHVDSPDPAMTTWIQELLLRHGIEIVDSTSEADVVVADLDPDGQHNWLNLPSDVQVVGIQSMTTAESVSESNRIGIKTVVPKLAIDHVLPDAIVAAMG